MLKENILPLCQCNLCGITNKSTPAFIQLWCLKKTLVFQIGILIEEGQLVKCGNIPYSGKSVPELSIILQVLTVHFPPVRHFVPKVFSTELALEESKVVVRVAVKEAYVVYVFV